MGSIKRRHVLFADLRGSTALYEAMGNARAAVWVTQAIQRVGKAVETHKGVVVKTLGDGLMAVFPRGLNAVAAAFNAQEVVNAPMADPALTQGQLVPHLHLQLSLAVGDVVEVGGDCFGDAVNVAARLLDHADNSETLITKELWAELPSAWRAKFRRLNKMQLRGRNEPVEVYVFATDNPDSVLTHQGSRSLDAISPTLGLVLRWRGKSLCRTREQLPLVIGRGRTSEVVVDDARVSRSHARVEGSGAALQLTDLSINGTFVRFGDDDEVLSLRRGSCTLHGHGEIGLGAPPDINRTPTLLFSTITDPIELQYQR